MKKLAIVATAVLGLVLFGAPQSNACSTHGYVRASTLNDLFQTLPQGTDAGLVFEAHDVGTNAGTGGGNLSDAHLLDTGHYDDGHSFGWKMKGDNNGNWHELTTGENAQTQLDDIVAAIETNMSESMDKHFAD